MQSSSKFDLLYLLFICSYEKHRWVACVTKFHRQPNSYTVHVTFIGERESAINVAEGKKQSQILASEAFKMEQINKAMGKIP